MLESSIIGIDNRAFFVNKSFELKKIDAVFLGYLKFEKNQNEIHLSSRYHQFKWKRSHTI